jgi:hypothetical protein
MQLELNEAERDELVELIKAAHADLASEIHHASVNHYREGLRQRRVVLEGLLHRLGVETHQPA